MYAAFNLGRFKSEVQRLPIQQGMPMHHIPFKRYQQLQLEEPMTIASLLQQRYTITQIAGRVKRAAGAISGELNRTAQDEYLPKGTELSVYSQVQLDAIDDQINNRPRKGFFGGGIPDGVVHGTAAK